MGASRSYTFTLNFQWEEKETRLGVKRYFFFIDLIFPPSQNRHCNLRGWLPAEEAKQQQGEKNILLHKYYFTFCFSWFVVRTVAGQLALVMNFQDVRWAKEKKIIIFLSRCRVARQK